mmetsp:Transcript_111549/g.314974  ORF Transcript_111549/g.314974 Transcript_111549/m.314974 type:complete len:327 (-) Transcript_111549:27-1007(-)
MFATFCGSSWARRWITTSAIHSKSRWCGRPTVAYAQTTFESSCGLKVQTKGSRHAVAASARNSGASWRRIRANAQAVLAMPCGDMVAADVAISDAKLAKMPWWLAFIVASDHTTVDRHWVLNWPSWRARTWYDTLSTRKPGLKDSFAKAHSIFDSSNGFSSFRRCVETLAAILNVGSWCNRNEAQDQHIMLKHRISEFSLPWMALPMCSPEDVLSCLTCWETTSWSSTSAGCFKIWSRIEESGLSASLASRCSAVDELIKFMSSEWVWTSLSSHDTSPVPAAHVICLLIHLWRLSARSAPSAASSGTARASFTPRGSRAQSKAIRI